MIWKLAGFVLGVVLYAVIVSAVWWVIALAIGVLFGIVIPWWKVGVAIMLVVFGIRVVARAIRGK